MPTHASHDPYGRARQAELDNVGQRLLSVRTVKWAYSVC